MESGTKNRVTVDHFRSRAGKLWLTLLILAPLFGAAFAVFAWRYSADGLVVIIGCVAFSVLSFGLFGVCIAAAKLRTSRWTADEAGIAYFCLGRKVAALSWREVREAGLLRLGGEKRGMRLVLYWSGHELRGKGRGGEGGTAAGLGANVRGADVIVCPVSSFGSEDGSYVYSADDDMLAFTRAHFGKPLRHEELLQKVRD